jgi:hypothetical protein
MKHMAASDRYVIEVQSGYAKRVIQLLTKAGAQNVVNAGMGYLYMTGTPEIVGKAKAWRGVRAVMRSGDVELPALVDCPKSSSGVCVPGGLVKLSLGGTAVVGRVTQVEGEKATVVFSLLGRPIEQQLTITELEEVVLPEVWQ